MLFPSVNNAPSWTATQHSRQSQWWTAPKKSAPLRRHHPGSISGCGSPFRNAHTATNWPGDTFLRTSSQYWTHNKLRRFQNNNYKLNRKRVIEGWSQNGMRRLGLVSTPWWEEGTGERLLAHAAFKALLQKFHKRIPASIRTAGFSTTVDGPGLFLSTVLILTVKLMGSRIAFRGKPLGLSVKEFLIGLIEVERPTHNVSSPVL